MRPRNDHEDVYISSQLIRVSEDIKDLTKAMYIVAEQVKHIKKTTRDNKEDIKILLEERNKRNGAMQILSKLGKPMIWVFATMVFTIISLKPSAPILKNISEAETITRDLK